jgi:hypothetical protein
MNKALLVCLCLGGAALLVVGGLVVLVDLFFYLLAL